MESILNPTVITLISVITTGLVSILSIFLPSVIEWLKARQANISSEKDRIETTTLDLLREISHFRRPIQFDIESSSGRSVQQTISDMQVKHYAWERAIWNKVGEKNQKQIITLRQKFESMSGQNLGELAQQLSDVTDEILTLTRIASDRF
jgi:hypothetical protein